ALQALSIQSAGTVHGLPKTAAVGRQPQPKRQSIDLPLTVNFRDLAYFTNAYLVGKTTANIEVQSHFPDFKLSLH
ncbi:MAG: hypothetical protein ACYDB8_04420, partial [Acidiferrobacterales bacterium]